MVNIGRRTLVNPRCRLTAEDGTLRPFSLGAVYRKGEHISRIEFGKRFPFAAQHDM